MDPGKETNFKATISQKLMPKTISLMGILTLLLQNPRNTNSNLLKTFLRTLSNIRVLFKNATKNCPLIQQKLQKEKPHNEETLLKKQKPFLQNLELQNSEFVSNQVFLNSIMEEPEDLENSEHEEHGKLILEHELPQKDEPKSNRSSNKYRSSENKILKGCKSPKI